MKKVLLVIVLIFGLSEITSAQIKPKVKKYPSQHVCNSSCKDSNHCYRHGENNHSCEMNTVDQKMEVHKCNADCMSKKQCSSHSKNKHSCCENKPNKSKEIDKTEEKMNNLEEKIEK